MRIVILSGHQLNKNRKRIISFIQKNGDRRITNDAIRWVKQANVEDVAQEGTLLICALEQHHLIGIAFVVNYGIDESFIIVHHKHRKHHVATTMVKEVTHRLGKIYGRIATDNIPSLKLCLNNGMVAFDIFTGPTGKPTLWLGGGAWKKEDVL